MRKPVMISMVCLLAALIIVTYTWLNLPEMDRYPLHWGPDGQPDRFGSKKDVLVNLGIFPIGMIFMLGLFWFMPRIEPLRENLQASMKAYNLVWVFVMVFFVGMTGLISASYLTEGGASMAVSPRLIVIAMAVLFIGIGNVLGKVRQNFMFGIRTPWTLSSELSWEKTHRVGGRLFVLVGVLSFITAIIAPNMAIGVFTASLLMMVAVVFAYSYIIWKNDPNKRQSGQSK